ncbi:P-type conjugative transfer protein TrbG [Brevundimonas diminuta]|uniref:P-type conjugative transfer protein TrbG n=1 Tax=Brevundimonas diminuta TaxID=293 RepID=UPI0019BC7697|nr:P-type conjugative transfer protein TrbG [Brevundimonas diminuta]MBD3818146.1 P-type conjugative transfer protein TrbG [Brevundimonas diminuta]
MSRLVPPAIVALLGLSLSGCATTRAPAPAIAYDDFPKPAQLIDEPPPPVEIVETPTSLPLPGQMKPVDLSAAPEPGDPPARIAEANAAARMEPVRDGFINAIQVYPWTDGALYQVYAAPGQVTDIALQEGETLAGPGPVAAGDTARWIIGDTRSGSGASQRVHILVKPTRSDLATNLIINTDRRTYHLELRATPRTWMASVSWTYPQDRLIALRAQNQQAAASGPAASGLDVERLNFRYKIEGDAAPWRPLRAFDDGAQVFIQFPAGIGQGEMPPLFILGAANGAELVNYRVRDATMVVDRLFAAAELRLGADPQIRVRIVRDDAAAPPARRGARR